MRLGTILAGLTKMQTARMLIYKIMLASQVEELIGSTRKPLKEPLDVVLYGFGRIGRLMARLLIEKTGGGDTLRLRAVVVRKGCPNDLIKRASLLETDSVHGRFDGTIRVDEERCAFVANGNEIRVIYASEPDKIDYTQYGINNALVIDNTGKWRDKDGLGLHLKAKGVSKVMLTAPGKGDIKNIVAGINDGDIAASDDTILSAASCTTNAITPPLCKPSMTSSVWRVATSKPCTPTPTIKISLTTIILAIGAVEARR